MINLMQPDLGAAELARVEKVFESNWLGRGAEVKEFERRFAESLMASPEKFHAISCCTEGLFQAAEIFNFSKQDEIVVPTVSFVAAGSAVLSSEASLVLCDVDSRTLNTTAELIADKYTSKTKAIILNHYGGYPCDMVEIMSFAREKNLIVIEDSACAVRSFVNGQACGTIGDMGIWSFDSMKTLVTGDGGMVYLRDAEKLNCLKEACYLGLPARDASGIDKVKSGDDIWWEVQINRPGRRAIMNNISAAIGNAQLDRLDKMISRRKEITKLYNKLLAEISELQVLPTEDEGIVSSYYFYWIQVSARDSLARFLKERGIYTSFRYWPLNWIDFFSQGGSNSFPLTEYAARNTLNLPLHQSLTDEEVYFIADQIKEFFQG